MDSKLISQDPNYDEWCEEDILNAYREAANVDEFLFGDYDYKKVWINSLGDEQN